MHSRRIRAAAALAAVAALVIAGCSSGPAQPKPGASSGTGNPGKTLVARDKQLTIALVSCFYRRHLISKAAVTRVPRLPVHSGQVAVATPADQSAVLLWFASVGQTLVVKGVTMGAWLGDSDTDPSSWPVSMCGPIPPPPS